MFLDVSSRIFLVEIVGCIESLHLLFVVKEHLTDRSQMIILKSAILILVL
jgi:hypothetical protein